MRDTGFLDLLFNMVLGFLCLFILSFMMIKPLVKKADARNRAEYLITVSWPDDFVSDVDTWVADPIGNVVWFRNKERGLMHLDRDDLGTLNDSVTLADGTVLKCPRNQEQVTVRGFIAGEWAVNVHMYKLRDKDPVKTKVIIDRINPTFMTVFAKELILDTQWQEITATRFEMLSNGDIIAFDDTYKQIVQTGGPGE